MSDIVKRLRAGIQCDEAGNRCRTMDARSGCVCAEAAEEITRLRNGLHIAQEWSARVMAGRERDVDEITRLRAEVERLRAVLHYYADFHENPNDGPWGMQSDDFGRRARAALGDTHE